MPDTFVTENNYFLVNALVYHDNNGLLADLELNNQKYKIILGKDIKDIKSFDSLSQKFLEKREEGNIDKIAIKMFYKQMYGRLMGGKLNEKGCYGNWEISFVWQGYLKGKVKHDLNGF